MDDGERAAIFRLHAEFCKSLSDANRLLIITVLARGETSVNELAQKLGLKQSNVSKHLSLMREHGLVNARRQGLSIYYNLSDRRIFEAIKMLQDVQADQIEKRRKLAAGIAQI
ncbi:MAG TPA: metalloregulator ArsR/SmtB family transcription factor [Dehalococcoidales bacterium]|nr:metalloregulator ArsR/SmtB family transcription factor [Dehalococcoidales bacterium]